MKKIGDSLSIETADSIHTFWFGTELDDGKVADLQKSLWWSKDVVVDDNILLRFEKLSLARADGALSSWEKSPRGLLALILLTDQFPRNMYRGTSAAFLDDPIAVQLCKYVLAQGIDKLLRPIERVFVYLPLEHSENIDDQQRSVELFKQLANVVDPTQKEIFDGFHQFAIRHRDIIARFGRFPHRNQILRRDLTTEEIAFLETPCSSF